MSCANLICGLWCRYINCDLKNITTEDEILEMLPNVPTKIRSVDIIEEDLLKISFIIGAKSGHEFEEWLRIYEAKSFATYSISSTRRCTGKRLLFRQDLHCQHNTQCSRTYEPHKNNRTRNTNCRASLNVKVRSVSKRKYQGKDPEAAPNPLFPCEIVAITSHNHNLRSADSLRFRAVSEETQNKLIGYYQNGHTPATALDSLKSEIQLTYENYEKFLADRKYCPDYNYCYYLFRKEFKEKYGPLEFNSDAKVFLENRLIRYGLEMGDSNCARVIFSESDYVICICSPLMKRVHERIKAASEMVFMDSSGTIDNENSRVFVLLTHSACGGLPLSVFITSSESTNIICKAFTLMKEMVGQNLFGGNVNGPQIFITDDSLAEQAAISSIWPQSQNLLCTFHVLQAVWRWLVKSRNGIDANDRYVIYQDFRRILYATNLEECEKMYKIALENAEKYQNYVEYLNGYWDRKKLWALSYRRNLLVRGNNTNNISEAAIRVLKEKIFERVKAYNLVQMVDFMLTKFALYYERRLLDAAHNRTIKNFFGKAFKMPKEEIVQKIQQVANNIYLIPSETQERLNYIVNTEVLICTCVEGATGRMCKHITWVCMLHPSDEYLIAVDTDSTKSCYYFIAMGKEPPKDWLMPLYTQEVHYNSGPLQLPEQELDPICDTTGKGSVINEVLFIDDSETLVDKGNPMCDEFSNLMKKCLKNSPHEMLPAISTGLNKALKMNTSALASALINFGSEFKRRNRMRRIPIQPTAPPRRKNRDKNLGRQRQVGGRPRKVMGVSKKKKKNLSDRIRRHQMQPTDSSETTWNVENL